MTDRRIGVVLITHDRREDALAGVGRLLALDAVGGAGRVRAERRPVPATVEARLSASDGPQRTSRTRRYAG